MAQNRPEEQKALKSAVERFLAAKQDESTVNEVEQQLQVHVVGTTAYVPAYTRSIMDKNFGAPVMAVHTRTDAEGKVVYLYPAKDPDSPDAKRLRSSDAMGAAYLAFGVPLRKLKLKLDVTRRIILPLKTLEVPDEGTVYWASFAEIMKERRDVDMAAVAAAKQKKAQRRKGAKPAASKEPASSTAE